MLGTMTFDCFLVLANISNMPVKYYLYSGNILLMLANINSFAVQCLLLCWQIFVFKVQAVPAQPHGQHGGGTPVFPKVRFGWLHGD